MFVCDNGDGDGEGEGDAADVEQGPPPRDPQVRTACPASRCRCRCSRPTLAGPTALQAVYLKDLYDATSEEMLQALKLEKAPTAEAWLGEPPPSLIDVLVASMLEDAKAVVRRVDGGMKGDVAKRVRDQLCAAVEVLTKKPKPKSMV